MKLTRIACLLAVLFASTTFAQQKTILEKAVATTQNNGVVDGSEMNLEFVNIRDASRRSDAYRMLDRLYGRRVHVKEGGSVRTVSNLQTFGESIVLYDTKEMIAKIKKTIAKLLSAPSPEVTVDRELIVREYKPRFISTNDARSALEPFSRNINIGTSQHSNNVAMSQQSRRNLTVLDERGLIIMRDTAEQVNKMAAVLEGVDKPKTQFMVSCMLIQGSKTMDDNMIEDERLKKILPQELRDISPFKTFQMVSSGVIRVAAGSGRKVSLSMSGSGSVTANLLFVPTSFDPKSGTLGLGEVTVDYRKMEANGQRTQQSFATTTSIQMHDYVVIGAFGDNPVFAVLHLIPIK